MYYATLTETGDAIRKHVKALNAFSHAWKAFYLIASRIPPGHIEIQTGRLVWWEIDWPKSMRASWGIFGVATGAALRKFLPGVMGIGARKNCTCGRLGVSLGVATDSGPPRRRRGAAEIPSRGGPQDTLQVRPQKNCSWAPRRFQDSAKMGPKLDTKSFNFGDSSCPPFGRGLGAPGRHFRASICVYYANTILISSFNSMY